METLKECIIKIMLDSIKLYPFQEGSQGAIIMIKKKNINSFFFNNNRYKCIQKMEKILE